MLSCISSVLFFNITTKHSISICEKQILLKFLFPPNFAYLIANARGFLYHSCHKTGPGTHICTCKRGFSRISDTSCSPIDPCVSNPGICGDNSICKNIAPDEYVCSCFENFISKNGADCVPINPCTTTVDCGSTAICVFEGPGNYSCVSCPDGFEISDPECTINNPCMDETICGEHEECVFLGGKSGMNDSTVIFVKTWWI